MILILFVYIIVAIFIYAVTDKWWKGVFWPLIMIAPFIFVIVQAIALVIGYIGFIFFTMFMDDEV